MLFKTFHAVTRVLCPRSQVCQFTYNHYRAKQTDHLSIPTQDKAHHPSGWPGLKQIDHLSIPTQDKGHYPSGWPELKQVRRQSKQFARASGLIYTLQQ